MRCVRKGGIGAFDDRRKFVGWMLRRPRYPVDVAEVFFP